MGTRAQCIVCRGNKLLMAKHRLNGEEWWCLPGGGVEEGETPAEAAIRELKEECCVDGIILNEVSHITYPQTSQSYTYLIDIGLQTPRLCDQESRGTYLVDMAWLNLEEIPERDRAYLWWAGLLSVPQFISEVDKWGDSISYPQNEIKI